MSDFGQSRRAILGSIAGFSAATGTVAATSSSDSKLETTDLDDIDVYVDGLDVATTSDVGQPQNADLAVLGSSTSVSPDDMVSSINNETTVARTQRYSLRHLLNEFDRSSEELDYSLGYEMSSGSNGLALARPAPDGVLELNTFEYGFDSDSDALDTALNEYDSISNRVQATAPDFSGPWERRGNSTAKGKACPGGDRARTVNFYRHEEEDGWAGWSWRTDMTPEKSPKSECNDFWYNHWNWKNMEDYNFNGTIESWGPSTTSGQTSASVSLSAGSGVSGGASWSYSIPDTIIKVDKSNYNNELKWTHRITANTYQSKHTFDCVPGAIVKYDSGERFATYQKETKSVFKQPKWNNFNSVENDGYGAWPL